MAIQWSPQYSAGVRAIDDDHRELFSLVDMLDRRAKRGDREPIRVAIDSLLTYVHRHFEREERFMAMAGYPELDSHVREHRKFTGLVEELAVLFKEAPDRIDAVKVTKVAHDWLVTHILKSDMAYVPYVTGQTEGVRDDGDDRRTLELSLSAEDSDLVRRFLTIVGEGGEKADVLRDAVDRIFDSQGRERRRQAEALFCID